MPKQVKAEEAAQYYQISISNLRKWAREGRITVSKTPGGHYVYHIPDINDPLAFPNTCDWCPNIIYSRVSSRKQRDNLGRQSAFLQTRYPSYTLIEDIGSGINYKRPGFRAILEQLFKGNIKTVVVAHPDRFTRFSFDFFQWLFQQFGAVLDAVEHPEAESGNELVDDIMEVFTVFTARYYGSRKYKLSGDKESKTTPHKKTKATLSEVPSTSPILLQQDNPETE
jgi:putative resolvase